jgi:hypothetical protein
MDVSHGHDRPGPARFTLAAATAAACAAHCASATPQHAVFPQRQFAVFLDDRRIGTHRFDFAGSPLGDTTTVTSTASFTVKILGIPAYRYRHQASEGWRDGCLETLVASTDDNGHRLRIDAHREGTVLRIRAGDNVRALPGCVMSYAYWDLRLVAQDRLLNPQTGAYDAVRSQLLGSERLDLPAGPVAAQRYRLSADGLSIDLWYSPEGEWLQLDSTTRDGRRLRYRLE